MVDIMIWLYFLFDVSIIALSYGRNKQSGESF